MAEANRIRKHDLSNTVNEGKWPGIDSTYRLIVVAALRTKQLLRGSHPRIEADPKARRHRTVLREGAPRAGH